MISQHSPWLNVQWARTAILGVSPVFDPFHRSTQSLVHYII